MSPRKGMAAVPGEFEWHCPYCNATKPNLREIQTHITESTKGDHEGISGESPDEDIIGIDPETDEEVDIYEAADVVRPKDAPLQGVSTRKQTVAAWIANDQEEDADALAAVTDADREYSQQILGQIRRGEIDQDYRTNINRAVIDTMQQRLEEYRETDTIETEVETMTAEQTEVEEEERDIEGVTAKAIVLNAFDLVDEDINRKQTWEALREAGIIDTGYEHFRRTFADAASGEISREEIDEAVESYIQSSIEPVLIQTGVIGDVPESAAEELQQRETSTEGSDTTSEVDTSRTRGAVMVEDIEDVRDRVQLLREQAEFEAGEGVDSCGNRKAEFMGKKTVEWLNELIKQANQ